MTLTQPTTAYRDALLDTYKARIETNPDLDRRLVSYQANKQAPFYGWFKYREGFTAHLVHYLLAHIHPQPGRLLDPFAGSYVAPFAAASRGWVTSGIEVLPVGIHIARSRSAAHHANPQEFAALAQTLATLDYRDYYDECYALRHIPITRGAFTAEAERDLIGFIAYCHSAIADPHLRTLALFASFCILEEMSFTRKDGQYLRWDYRSGRSQGKKPFDKGVILSFRDAIRLKLDQMAYDLLYGHIFDGSDTNLGNDPEIIQGSCLDILPDMAQASYDVIFTSPPYCNRYDYTRTYALELIYLGSTHEQVAQLRQAMLSCTVENKSKQAYMRQQYENRGRLDDYVRIDSVFQQQQALQEVLDILDTLRDADELNNEHIARLVRNYFYEMCFVVAEMARVLTPGGHVIMVNDNVRYAGEEVPVDIILSSFAESFGLTVDKIWTLPRGKGNSSQQMGEHGRSELRKCVYIWSKSR